MSRNDSRSILQLESLRQSLLYRTYPKELPPISLGNVYDENGFTGHERATLRNGWRLIEPHKRRIGRNVYYTFLVRNEHQINTFRAKNTEIKMPALHGHALSMMNLLEALITNLDKPIEFHLKLQALMPIHVTAGIHKDYMNLLSTELKKALLKFPKLSVHMTRSLENGLTKLTSIVGNFNETEGERRILSQIKYSVLKGEEDGVKV